MRYTVPFSLREYGENRRTESRTSLVGLDEIAFTRVRLSESKERLS